MGMQKKVPIEICTSTIINYDTVQKVTAQMLDDSILHNLASFFKVFGHPTRVRMLQALLISEMCVCDLSYTLNMTQSAVSHQLRLLKDARLVKSRKDGKVVYYSLDDEHISSIMNEGLKHIKE